MSLNNFLDPTGKASRVTGLQEKRAYDGAAFEIKKENSGVRA